jgi:hypothetical protein
MVHQDGHGLVKLAILIWLTDLLIMPTKQPTYLLTYLYLPIYLPSIYLCHIYLLLCTYYLPKLFIHLPIYLYYIYLSTYIFIYLVRYLLTYLLKKCRYAH